MGNLRKILIFLMAVVMLICSGCDDPKNGGMTDKSSTEKTDILDSDSEQSNKDPKLPPKPPQPKSDKKDETGQAKKMKVKVYYPDESGLRLVGVNREVEVNDTDESKYKAAVEAVMTPPKEKNLTKVVSIDSSLIDVKVKDGTALVNLSKNIKIGFVGGSTGEELLIGSVVNTLTEFKEVNAVKFLIDGQEVETLSGHMDLSEPIKRMENLMKH